MRSATGERKAHRSPLRPQAEAALAKVEYRITADTLAQDGFGPENSAVGASVRLRSGSSGRLKTLGRQPGSRSSTTSVQAGMALALTIRIMAWRQMLWESETVFLSGADFFSLGLPA